MSKKCRFKRSVYRAIKKDIDKAMSRTRKTGRPVSRKTESDRYRLLMRFCDEIYKKGYKPEKAENLKPKHLDALFETWRQRQLKYKTVQTYLSHCRYLVEKLKRPDLKGHINAYAKRARELHGAGEAVDRAAILKQVDLPAILEKVFLKDSLVFAQLILQWRFGLRIRESHRMRPAESYDSRGNLLKVERGGKGGRTRVVLIEREEDRKFMEQMKKLARSIGGSMMPRTFTEKQWRQHYNYVLRECRITKKGLGFTSHSLRHAFAQNLYEQVSGMKAPVSLAMTSITNERDREGRIAIAEALGHGRYDITKHYLDLIESLKVEHHTRMRRPRGQGLRREWPRKEARNEIRA